MKFTTKIYRDYHWHEWQWKIKFIDVQDYEYIIQELPFYQMPRYITSYGSIEGFETTLDLEIAKADLDASINIIKIIIIQRKNETKQKEFEERIGERFVEKLWEWNDNSNEFKEVYSL